MTSVKPVGPTVLVLPKTHGPGGPGAGGGHVGVSARSQADAGFVPGQLLVKFKDGTSAQVQQRLLDRVQGDVGQEVAKLEVGVVNVPVTETADALQALDASPTVEYVERDTATTAFGRTPNDPLWPSQWGAAHVKLPDVWGVPASARVVVAVLDSGVDAGHPDLRGVVLPGRNIVDGDNDTDDLNGHGTAAAGVLAARANNGLGQAGVCWACVVMPVKVLDADNKGTTSDLAAGIVWAADHGAQVINMSLGGYGPTQTLGDAVSYAAGKGIILVGAAGNYGSATPVYPAAYPEVLGVAGTTAGNALYSWSSYGSWVDVAAPGCNVAPWLNQKYVNFCGTSSATPIVAGLAGLAMSVKPGASSVEIEEALQTAAIQLPSGIVQHGFVNAPGMLSALGVKAAPAAERPAPAAASARGAVIADSLTSQAPVRRYTRKLGDGQLTAELSFQGRKPLTLTIEDPSGARLARASGRSPVRIVGALGPGTYTFSVSGSTASTFSLNLSLEKP